MTKYYPGAELCFGDVLELAESLGWVDPDLLPWSPDNADATEQSALEHIAKAGIEIHSLGGFSK
tara:strand:+ start:837 stop:1028 length:192 start_codon:yes stop_codon:yes gene_type:complete